MAHAGDALLAGLDEVLARQLAHGLEHVEPRLAAQLGADEQALLDQGREPVERVHARVRQHRLGRRLREAALEHAQSAKHHLLLRTQQAQAPFDGRAQRLVAFRQVALAGGKQRERAIEPRQHRLR